MLLFLDVASPIPEFHLINDKKIIVSTKIIEEFDQKLSDKIIPIYLEINKTFNLFNSITNLIITIGPGSYTALRVGASFISGLSQSMKLPVSVISSENVYDHFYTSNQQTGIYFESSNNQNFFSYKKDELFFHEKVEDTNYNMAKSISHVLYNLKPPKFIDKKVILEPFSLKQFVLKNLPLIEFKKNLIIKPIYISNNNILN